MRGHSLIHRDLAWSTRSEDPDFTLVQAIQELDTVISTPFRYTFAIRALFMCCCSAGCGIVFFGLPAVSWVLAGALGIVLECMDYAISQKFQNARLVFEVSYTRDVQERLHVGPLLSLRFNPLVPSHRVRAGCPLLSRMECLLDSLTWRKCSVSPSTDLATLCQCRCRARWWLGSSATFWAGW